VIDHEQKLPLRGMLGGGEKKMRKRGEREGVGWGYYHGGAKCKRKKRG